MIYDPAAHEPLTATEWDPARAEEGVAGVVALDGDEDGSGSGDGASLMVPAREPARGLEARGTAGAAIALR